MRELSGKYFVLNSRSALKHLAKENGCLVHSSKSEPRMYFELKNANDEYDVYLYDKPEVRGYYP